MVALLAIAMVATASAGTFVPASGDYAVDGNWDNGSVPAGSEQAWIGIGSVNAATYASSTAYTTSGRFLIGRSSGGDGTLTLNSGAGTLTFGGNNYGSGNYVGVDGGTGTLNLNAGRIVLSGNAGLLIGCNSGTTTGTVTVNGGDLDVGTRLYIARNGAGKTGTLTINSGTVNVGTGNNTGERGTLRMGTGAATINLNGGVLSLERFVSDGTASNSAGNVINLNGGTLQARADEANFLAADLYSVNVKNGGFTFDTAGHDVTLAAALAEDPGSTGGGMIKDGAGTLRLTAANTYTGPTIVREGTLLAAGGNPAPNVGSLQTSAITVESGGTLLIGANDTFDSAGASPGLTITVQDGGLFDTGSNYFTTIGPLQLQGGQVHAGGGVNTTYRSLQLTSSVTHSGNATSTITGDNTTNSGVQLRGTLNFDVADGTPAEDLVISANVFPGAIGGGGIHKHGDGTMVLSGTTTLPGDVRVYNGTLEVRDDMSSPNRRFIAGHGSGSNGTLVVDDDAALSFGGNDLDVANYVGVDGATGHLDVVDGSITISTGALRIGSNAPNTTGTAVIRKAGTVTLGTGGSTPTLYVGAGNASNQGTLVVDGTLNVAGSGRVGDNGATGTLRARGQSSIEFGSNLSMLSTASTLGVEIVDRQFNPIAVNGEFVAGGSHLDVAVTGDKPGVGEAWDIVSYGVTGATQFDVGNSFTNSQGYGFFVDYGSGSSDDITLELTHHGDSLLIDVGSNTAVVSGSVQQTSYAGSVWNNLGVGTVSGSTYDGFVYADGTAAPGVTVTPTGTVGRASNSTLNDGWDDAEGVPQTVMDSWYFSNSNGMGLNVDGLLPGGLYDVEVFNAFNNAPEQLSDITINGRFADGTTGPTDPEYGDDWARNANGWVPRSGLLFEQIMADSSGRLAFSFQGGNPTLQAIRITASVPEPSGVVLGILGLLGLVFWRRPRRR